MSALPVVNPADFLPLPDAIEALSYEALVAQGKTEFKRLLAAIGIDYDVDVLETDPGVVLIEAESYVQLDTRQRVNDVYRALRLALAKKSNLDGLAADRGVKRLVLFPATATTAVVMEGDVSLLLRTWLAMQAWGSGSSYGVEYHARTLGIRHAASVGAVTLADVKVLEHFGEGRMTCVVLSSKGLDPVVAESMRAFIGNGLMTRARHPGSVWIDTVLAAIVTVPYAGVLKILRGASQAGLLAAAQGGLGTYMATRRRIGVDVPVSAMQAAQMGYGVIEAQASDPLADVAIPNTAAAELGEVNILPQVVDD